VTKTLLNRYLVKGTSEFEDMIKRSIKLSKVGLDTINLGGNRNSSSKGLKAVNVIYISGMDIKAAEATNMTRTVRFPPKERVSFLLMTFIINTSSSSNFFQ
jgi:hypothetical protein